MNCYNHPEEVAVAVCQDCQKGLCIECSSEYEIPICRFCNKNRIKRERLDIIKDWVIIIGVGLLVVILLNKFQIQYGGKSVYSFASIYICVGMVSGWKFLNRITPNIFLFMPIIGGVIYFLVKIIASLFIGPFVLPYKLFIDVKRWIELHKIER